MIINVIINKKTGEVEYEVEGVMGSKCTDITSALQKGHEILEEKYTEEYYVPEVNPAYIQDL